MSWIPEVITCMNRVCHRQQHYEVDDCIMVDFSDGCDVCGDLPCPTVVVPGRIASCTTFSCMERDSPCEPYIVAVPVSGGE